MESLQCLEDLPPERTVTPEMCFPSTAQLVADTKKLMEDNSLSVLFIAADKQPNLQEFKKGLGSDVSAASVCDECHTCTVRWICMSVVYPVWHLQT